jgi:hypothetical protein
MATFGLAFGGRPGRRTIPAIGVDMSGAESGSAAIAFAMRASSSAFGRMSFFFIECNLTAISLARRNDATAAVSFYEHNDMETRAKRRHRDQADLAVIPPTIFEYQRPIPIQVDEVAKIDPVIGNIGEAFVFVPGVHVFL